MLFSTMVITLRLSGLGSHPHALIVIACELMAILIAASPPSPAEAGRAHQSRASIRAHSMMAVTRYLGSRRGTLPASGFRVVRRAGVGLDVQSAPELQEEALRAIAGAARSSPSTSPA
jgi:hypothetical protein